MDKESLALIINGFEKNRFEKAANVVLTDILCLNAIYLETLSVKKGDRSNCNTSSAYALVMDRNNEIDKALLTKRIQKYKLTHLYVFYKGNMSEAEIAKRSVLLNMEFNLQVNYFCSLTIAGLIIDSNLEHILFEDGFEYRQIENNDSDYLAAAFHSFTIGSSDVGRLKGQVYDDAILFKASSIGYNEKVNLQKDVIEYLNLPQEKVELIGKRIDSLLSKGILRKEDGVFKIQEAIIKDIEDRKKAYLFELNSLMSAQADLMREEYVVDWTMEDSKRISTLLAFSAIEEKFKLLREAKVKIDHPIFRITKGSDDKILKYLKEMKGLSDNLAIDALQDLAQMASTHPLIIKITRACMYIALEGSNPLSAAQALGANNWKDFQVLLEPTVAIPYICSLLYDENVSKSYSNSVKSIRTAISMTSGVKIPYFYINECAGHLLSARKYDNLDLDPAEMEHSKNAFVANYFSLLNRNVKLPSTFMDYLATFSTAIKYERPDIKQWVRSIMTDLTSILMGGKIEQVILPFYEPDTLKDYESYYAIILDKRSKEKPSHLVRHDTMALKYVNDQVANYNKHWIILSYDTILSEVGNRKHYNGWICTPNKFLDMTSITKPLSETQMVSVIHNVASFSEKTLSVGAAIMDRIIQYTSADMKKWEFRQEIERFKEEIKQSMSNDKEIDDNEIIRRTDNFLKTKGIALNEREYNIEIKPEEKHFN